MKGEKEEKRKRKKKKREEKEGGFKPRSSQKGMELWIFVWKLL